MANNDISFWDGVKGAGDLTAQAVTSLGKGTYDLVDQSADGYALITDLFSNEIADATGIQGLRTNLSEKKGILDKGGELIAEGKKQINEATKSKLRDTNEGQLAYDVVGVLGELAAPAGGGSKVVKKIDTKSMVESLKKIPKAMDEIKAMMSKGEKVDKSKVSEIYNKYMGEVKVAPGKDDYVKSERRLNKEGQMDEIVGKYNAPSGEITLPETSDMDKIVGDFNKALNSVSPEVKDSLMKKYPKLSKALIGGGGVTAALGVLGAMRADEVESIKNDIASPSEDKKEGYVPSMVGSDEEPTTITEKKKELQAMKEKNAGTLNASTSVVDLMKMLGANSTMEARKILFEKLTSKPYEGTAEQNIQLKALIEEMFSTGELSKYIEPIKR